MQLANLQICQLGVRLPGTDNEGDVVASKLFQDHTNQAIGNAEALLPLPRRECRATVGAHAAALQCLKWKVALENDDEARLEELGETNTLRNKVVANE